MNRQYKEEQNFRTRLEDRDARCADRGTEGTDQELQKEEELITWQSRVISELKGGRELSNLTDVLEQHFTNKPISSQSLIPDSQWFALSPQEKYAFNLYERMVRFY